MKTHSFYHGISFEKWREVLKNGFLWEPRQVFIDGKVIELTTRVTYLAKDKDHARAHSRKPEVILKIRYNPKSDGEDDYEPGCWQFRVFTPIKLDQVEVISEEKSATKVAKEEASVAFQIDGSREWRVRFPTRRARACKKS